MLNELLLEFVSAVTAILGQAEALVVLVLAAFLDLFGALGLG